MHAGRWSRESVIAWLVLVCLIHANTCNMYCAVCSLLPPGFKYVHILHTYGEKSGTSLCMCMYKFKTILTQQLLFSTLIIRTLCGSVVNVKFFFWLDLKCIEM